MKHKVLIIDSDTNLSNAVSAFLKCNGFQVYQAFSGSSASELFEEHRPKLILIDSHLPDMHGVELCKEFKKYLYIGVIYLSAHGEKIHQLQGFHSGADDYIIKPFDFDILLARMNTLVQKLDLICKSIYQNHIPFLRTLHFDMYKNDVIYEGQYLELTPMEFKILYFLAQKRNYVTPSELLSHIHKVKQTNIEQSRTVSVHMASIRRKLQKVKKDKVVIISKYKKDATRSFVRGLPV